MPTHTDRKGRVWYVKRSRSKTGKERFTAPKDREKGENAASMPEGYEFHENVNAQVFVRKKRVSRIRPEEAAIVEEAVAKLETDCRVEVKAKEIVVYTSEVDQRDIADTVSVFGGFRSASFIEERLRRNAHFFPMMRFTLEGFKVRLFRVERMSFRGAPNWLMIAAPAPLDCQVMRFTPVLDDMEAFFTLF